MSDRPKFHPRPRASPLEDYQRRRSGSEDQQAFSNSRRFTRRVTEAGIVAESFRIHDDAASRMGHQESGLERRASESSLLDMDTLTPQHPLMSGYQSRVKAHLEKLLGEVRAEVAEANAELAQLRGQYQGLGQAIYAATTDLAKAHRDLSLATSDIDRLADQRTRAEEREAGSEEWWSETSERLRLLRLEERSLEEELTALNRHLDGNRLHIGPDDTKILATEARKAETDLKGAAKEKKRQDFLVDRIAAAAAKAEERRAGLGERVAEARERVAAEREALAALSTEAVVIRAENDNVLKEWQRGLAQLRSKEQQAAALQQQLRSATDEAKKAGKVDGAAKKATARDEKDRIMLQRRLEDKKEQVERESEDVEKLRQELRTVKSELRAAEKSLHTNSTELRLANTERKRLEDAVKEGERDVRGAVRRGRDSASSSASSVRARRHSGGPDAFRRQKARTRSLESKAMELEEEAEKVELRVAESEERGRLYAREIREAEEELQERDEQLRAAEEELRQLSSSLHRKERVLGSLRASKGGGLGEAGSEGGSLLEEQLGDLPTPAEYDRIAGLQNEWLRLQEDLFQVIADNNKRENSLGEAKDLKSSAEKRRKELQMKIAEKEAEVEAVTRELEREKKEAERGASLKKANGSPAAVAEAEKESGAREKLRRKLEEAELGAIQTEARVVDARAANRRLEAQLEEIRFEEESWAARLAQVAAEEASEAEDPEEELARADLHRLQLRLQRASREQAALLRSMEHTVLHREAAMEKGRSLAVVRAQKEPRAAGALAPTARSLAELRARIAQASKDVEQSEVEAASVRAQREEEKKKLAQLASKKESLEARYGPVGDVEEDENLDQFMFEASVLGEEGGGAGGKTSLAAERRRQKELLRRIEEMEAERPQIAQRLQQPKAMLKRLT